MWCKLPRSAPTFRWCAVTKSSAEQYSINVSQKKGKQCEVDSNSAVSSCPYGTVLDIVTIIGRVKRTVFFCGSLSTDTAREHLLFPRKNVTELIVSCQLVICVKRLNL